MEVGPCRVRSRNGKVLPLRQDSGLRLQAEVSWIVEGPVAAINEIAVLLPRSVCEPLASGVLVLSFGNSLGRYKAGPLGTLDVLSGKWGEKDYDHLLERITEEASALPFAAGTPSALPFERAVLGAKDVLYHAFTYLRHVLGPTASRAHALRPALEGILRDPHRRFRRTGVVVPVERARRIDARALHDVVSGRWPMMRAPRTAGPLALALGGHLPVELEETVALDTLDTPENRFVKSFLATCAYVVDQMRGRAMSSSSALRARIMAGCDTIERALTPVKHHSMWRAVGPMVHFPAASTVLHRRAAYRQVFRTYNRLRLGTRLPLDGPTAETLLEVKDIALLYEMWSCFGMIRALRGCLGDPAAVARFKTNDFQKGVPWEYRATWADGTSLTYNPRFSPAAVAARRSYSVALRPDLSLHVPPGRPNSGLHLFDAKFKVDWLSTAVPETEDEQAEDDVAVEERTGVFKRADLYKMHAYRDAIPKARSAWVLYPGSEARFFAHPGATGIQGVGAVPLGTGEVSDSLSGLVAALVGGEFVGRASGQLLGLPQPLLHADAATQGRM